MVRRETPESKLLQKISDMALSLLFMMDNDTPEKQIRELEKSDMNYIRIISENLNIDTHQCLSYYDNILMSIGNVIYKHRRY